MVGAGEALGSLAAVLLLALPAASAQAQSLEVIGACRDGVPNGNYELRMPNGRLRVVGAFGHGRKTGTFIFWTSGGARVAVIPYDDDVRSGTVASWYVTPGAGIENGRKLEAPYVADRLHGVVRSWHPNGALRAEYRYEQGVLIDAHAWTKDSEALPKRDAMSRAVRDAEANQRFIDALTALVQDHPPHCD